jgi:hypothetical protein
MNIITSVVFATVYGLFIRLLFGILGPAWEIMSISFLVFSPAIIGFLTVYFLPNEKVTNYSKAFFVPWWSTLVILIITIAFSIEGTICWAMIYPVFSVVAGLGGVVAYQIKSTKNRMNDRLNKMNLSFLILLPLMIGFIEKDKASQRQGYILSEELIINASPQQVWMALTKTGSILSQNHQSYLTRAMGFPKHVRTVLDTLAVGGRRKAYYEKGLYFNETIKKIEPGALLVLSIKTDPNKISPKVMDEHIVIGGKHLDILEDRYQLQAVTGGKCKLRLSSRFYLCTPFNWYSELWANLLMKDILKAELNLVNSRATTTTTNANLQ